MSQQSNPATLREALELAFYFAERHVPSKEGYCAKCGFCHCDRGHVLAMAKQGVLAALAASGTEAAPVTCESCKSTNTQREAVEDKIAEARSFLSNMRRDADDSKDPTLHIYAQDMEKYMDEISQALPKPTDAVAGMSSAPQQLQKASPEGEGRDMPWTPEVEAFRAEMMRRFSNKLSMEEIADFSYWAAQPQRESARMHHIWCKSLLKMDLPCDCGFPVVSGQRESEQPEQALREALLQVLDMDGDWEERERALRAALSPQTDSLSTQQGGPQHG